MVDEERDRELREERGAEELPDEAAPAEVPRQEILLPELPARGAAARSIGGTSIGRWASFGCLAVMIILVVVLMIGVGMTKRTVWIAVSRAQQRLIEELPRELSRGERLRTERNLQRFRARLEIQADPLPLMGEFLSRAQDVFADDVVSPEELSELNLFFESVLDGNAGADPAARD